MADRRRASRSHPEKRGTEGGRKIRSEAQRTMARSISPDEKPEGIRGQNFERWVWRRRRTGPDKHGFRLAPPNTPRATFVTSVGSLGPTGAKVAGDALGELQPAADVEFGRRRRCERDVVG